MRVTSPENYAVINWLNGHANGVFLAEACPSGIRLCKKSYIGKEGVWTPVGILIWSVWEKPDFPWFIYHKEDLNRVLWYCRSLVEVAEILSTDSVNSFR